MGRQAVAHRIGRGLGAIGTAGLGEDVADMGRHGVEADREHRGDVGVAAADRDEPQHFGLARGQIVVRRCGPRRSAQFVEAGGSALFQCAHADLARAFEAGLKQLQRARSPASPRVNSIVA